MVPGVENIDKINTFHVPAVLNSGNLILITIRLEPVSYVRLYDVGKRRIFVLAGMGLQSTRLTARSRDIVSTELPWLVRT
jgi:hypothetical protein